MKLQGSIAVHMRGEPVFRNPNFWDRLKKKLGAEPDLSTNRMRSSLEAAALVDSVRRVLSKLGATNAVSLVIDDQVLFQDRDGKPDDLGDLFLAFADHESVFGKGFRQLRLAVEHEEAGLRMVIEVIAQGEHPLGEPTARVAVGGRIKAFEPLRGEDADSYRNRVQPLTQDAGLLEVSRRQFESFVARLGEALRAELPEGQVAVEQADAMVVRPTSRPPRRAERPPGPMDRRYDPYDSFYPNPFHMMLGFMMWSSIFHMAMPPHVTVVDTAGNALGTPADIPREMAADPEAYDAEHGGGDYGAGDDGGGDFGGDGGDFGGFD